MGTESDESERTAKALEIYKKLSELNNAGLPEFCEVIQATHDDNAPEARSYFVERLIELEEKIENAPDQCTSGVRDFLKKELPSLGF